MIHETAIIDKTAVIESDVTIGPYSIIGKGVTIGSGSTIFHHVSIEKNTKIGKNCKIWPFSSIGSTPQDLSYNNEETFLEIGDNCLIRESVTISRGTIKENGITKIGNNVLLMASSHVGHDSIIGNNVIVANFAGITGHVQIQDHVIIGGLAGAHQFITIGEGSIISGGSMCNQDIFPFSNAQGDRAVIRGLNQIGMKRRGFSEETITLIKKVYKIYFMSNLPSSEAYKKINELYEENPIRELKVICDFIKNSKRSIARTN